MVRDVDIQPCVHGDLHRLLDAGDLAENLSPIGSFDKTLDLFRGGRACFLPELILPTASSFALAHLATRAMLN